MARHSGVLTAVGLTLLLLGTAFVAFPVAVALLGIDVSEPTPPGTYLLFISALYATDVVIAAGYLHLSGRGLNYLDVRWPTLRDLGYVVGAVALSFGVGIALSTLVFVFALPEPPATIFTDIELANPVNYLVFVPFALLVNGPVEEALFRGIIQKRLAADYSRAVALSFASALFALYHLPAFYAVLLTTTPPLSGLGVALAAFFAAGLILGAVYARTNNLTVPMLAHGVYNALAALMFYFFVLPTQA